MVGFTPSPHPQHSCVSCWRHVCLWPPTTAWTQHASVDGGWGGATKQQSDLLSDADVLSGCCDSDVDGVPDFLWLKANLTIHKSYAKLAPTTLSIQNIRPLNRRCVERMQSMFRMFTDIKLASQANKSNSLFGFPWLKETLTWCVETIFSGAEPKFLYLNPEPQIQTS